jgi:hypothetical protein
VLYGSAMSNSNVHNHGPLPVLVGRRGWRAPEGLAASLVCRRNTMSNLLLTILDKAGVPQEKVGDSTGLLTDL